MRPKPPWWPAGEEWPGRGPPWRHAPAHFRRRFLVVAVAFLMALIGIGVIIGLAVIDKQWAGGRPGPPREGRSGPWGVIWFAGFVAVVGGGATAIAYRRLSRPVGNLLGAAERVANGDYDVKVEPDGPRELRSLITTFNQMAERLAQSEAQRRRFLADITHELRTPLAVLQSRIEAQVDGIHPRDDEHLASLLEETQVLGRLVDDLHTLALAEAGRLALHREPIHPAAVVNDAVESYAAVAGRKNVSIEVELPPGLPETDADPTRIHQVLGNLLSNALRHTPAGGKVTIAVAGNATEVRFTISDTGPGFPEDQLSGVFERFMRSADSKGSGLGLSIARDLVEAHGGTIRSWNQPGGGAAIGFTLPVA